MREDKLKQYRNTVKKLTKYIPRNFIEDFCKNEGIAKDLSVRGKAKLILRCFPDGLSPNQEIMLLKLSDAFSLSYLSKEWIDYSIEFSNINLSSNEELKELLLSDWKREFTKHNYEADLQLGKNVEEHQIGLIFYFMQRPRSYEDYSEGFGYYNPKGRTFILIDTKQKELKISGNMKPAEKILSMIENHLKCSIKKIGVSQKDFDEELEKGDVTKLVFTTDPDQGSLKGVQKITLEGPAVEKGLKDLYQVLGKEFEKRIKKITLESSRGSLDSSGMKRDRGVDKKEASKSIKLTEFLKKEEVIPK